MNRYQLKQLIKESIKEILIENSESDRSYLELTKNPQENEKELQDIVNAAAKNNGYNIGPVWHRTPANFRTFDLSKSSRSAVFGPAIYATMENEFPWNPPWFSKNTREIMGGVSGKIIDCTNPIPQQDLDTLGNFVGRKIDSVPFITLENRFGSVTDGLKAAGYSAMIHNGPGKSRKHIAIFYPNSFKSIHPITYDEKGNVIPLSKRFNKSLDDINY